MKDVTPQIIAKHVLIGNEIDIDDDSSLVPNLPPRLTTAPIDEIMANDMKQHAPDVVSLIAESKELQDDVMTFVQSNLETFLVLIRLGLIRLLGNHVAKPGDPGASRDYATLSVALGRTAMINLYSEEDKVDCTWRNAVDESPQGLGGSQKYIRSCSDNFKDGVYL
jgi:hypothetical protein